MPIAAASPALTITDAALARVRELAAAAGHAAPRLRMAVAGGGCSGFQYDFHLAAARAADDLVVSCGGVELLIDPLSVPYLDGAELDFVDELAGAQFVVRNPNASRTCGCGSSFAA